MHVVCKIVWLLDVGQRRREKKATDYVLLESLLTPAALVVAGCTTRAPSLASLDSFLPEIGPDKNHDRSLAE